VIDAVAHAQSLSVPVSFDGNYRSKLWESWREEAPGILKEIFAHTSLLLGDDRDIGLVLGRNFDAAEPDARRRQAADAAFEAFPRLERIASTIRTPRSVDCHSYGAVMFTRGGTIRVDDLELEGIVDRVGTGDAFAAGVIHGLVGGHEDGDALRFGHAAACLKHSVPGDFLGLDARAVEAAMASDRLDVRR
jgi:2-dehydro-3-deoxygluconokinase